LEQEASRKPLDLEFPTISVSKVGDRDGEWLAQLAESPDVAVSFDPCAGMHVGVQPGNFAGRGDEDLHFEGLLGADHLGCQIVDVRRGFGARSDIERMDDGVV
jgi:hypothetical protein